ncbi:MAG: hypothetical protein R3F56_07950 [Planctomycetota bacterium]
MTTYACPPLRIVMSFATATLAAAAGLAQEREFNDRPAFAQDLGVVNAETRTLAAVHEARAALDMFAFETVAEGVVTLDGIVYASNGTKLTSSNGASTGILLPPGRYLTPQSSTAVQTYPAPYTMSVRHEAAALPLLPPNGSVDVTFTRASRYSFRPALLRLQVPVEGSIDVHVPTGLRPDLFAEDMGLIRDWMVDGPALLLPAGTYFLRIPGSSVPATVQCSFTPTPVPLLAANSTVIGTLASGSRYAAVYRFALAAPARVGLTLQPDAQSGLPVANLLLADRLMNTIFEADETSPQPNQLDVTLPAGTYYAAVWAPQFTSGAGRFTLTHQANAAQIVAAQPSVAVRSSLLPNRADTYAVEVRTPSPLGALAQFDAGAYDYLSEVALLDDGGRLLGRSLWFPQTDALGQEVAAGTYFVLVRHQTNEPRSYVLTLDGALRQSAGDVQSTGVAGDVVLPLASVASLPTPINPLPGLFEGLLLVDPVRGVVLPPAVLPADGQWTWGVPFAATTGVFLQAVHLEPSLGHGRFANDLR